MGWGRKGREGTEEEGKKKERKRKEEREGGRELQTT